MIKPLQNYVILDLIEENSTKNGIIIPDNSKQKPTKGIVVAVGEGAYLNGTYVATSLQIGQKVLYPKWAGSFSEIEIDDKKYGILRETDIMAIIED